MNVLVIGSGGREHALAWKLRQSPQCHRLYAAPGNAGIGQQAELLPLAAEDAPGLTAAVRRLSIDLAVIGPEVALAAGVADALRDADVATFGPSKAATRIESSKAYARRLMTRVGAPQPDYHLFSDWPAARAHLERLATEGVSGVVVKASGLAAGKGALVCDSLEAAGEAARRMLVDRAFGEAGAEVLIEERLQGPEASLFTLTGGDPQANDLVLLPAAQDYKRALDGDRGLNTGGMGCHAPSSTLTPELMARAIQNIVRPTLRGLAADGAAFRGCLYTGLMLTDAGPKTIEHNARFGDPETQALLPLLESDLLPVLHAAAVGALQGTQLEWSNQKSVLVVLASGGYPQSYETGYEIRGLEQAAAMPGVTVFHAGTAADGSGYVTNGGRVLNVVAVGETYAVARARAYQAVDALHFQDCFCRRDIAAEVAAG